MAGATSAKRLAIAPNATSNDWLIKPLHKVACGLSVS